MKHLVVLRGPIGAGKTTIANHIATRQYSTSFVELDGLKRMIYPNGAPEWRREIAVKSGVFMTRLLLERGRSVVTETPALWPGQMEQFHKTADALPDVMFPRFLIVAPFAVCAVRSRQRKIPGMNYKITDETLETYYKNLDPQPGEPVFDTTDYTPEQAALGIIHIIAERSRELETGNKGEV